LFKQRFHKEKAQRPQSTCFWVKIKLNYLTAFKTKHSTKINAKNQLRNVQFTKITILWLEKLFHLNQNSQNQGTHAQL